MGRYIVIMGEQPRLFGEDEVPSEAPRLVPVRPYKRRVPTRKGLDSPEGRRAAQRATQIATEDAIARAEAHMDPEWAAVALACTRHCADTLAEFTADEVWQELESYPELGTHEPAALGPVFLRAAKLGWIAKAGRTRKRSVYARRHRELTVWVSLVLDGGQHPPTADP